MIFTEEEFNGMYGTACDALNSGTTLKESYRAVSDLHLLKASEVSLTAMGSSTCWNSSLGYYYYTGDAPTNRMDLNIIMVFPNTQDGEWPRGSYPNNKYNGNIGALRGDVVQLMCYPVKADGNLDLEHGSTVFPAGTKIGFVLKTNAWGQRGKDYAVNGNSYAKKHNIWASTTDGLSGAYDTGVKYPNENGEARSAKFAYTAPNGNEYVVVSFEDACDDNVKKSNGQKMYYVGNGEFPFAFYLEGVSISEFQQTILKRENESKRIDVFFPGFLDWSISEGKKNSDWYLNHLDSEVIDTTE